MRRHIRRLANVHGVARVRLFGSRRANLANPSGDLDLLVDLEAGRDLLDLAAFKLDLKGALGCEVDVVTTRGLSPYLRRRILKEARAL